MDYKQACKRALTIGLLNAITWYCFGTFLDVQFDYTNPLCHIAAILTAFLWMLTIHLFKKPVDKETKQ